MWASGQYNIFVQNIHIMVLGKDSRCSRQGGKGQFDLRGGWGEEEAEGEGGASGGIIDAVGDCSRDEGEVRGDVE